jgi:ribonucleoside-diphosphate reductase alpha chain
MEHPILSMRANVALLCIAPTGSTSLIHNVSSGIEPYFYLVYNRRFKDTGVDEFVINKHLEQLLRSRNMFTHEIINKIITDGIGSIALEPDIVSLYVTANEIAPLDHLRVQAVAQSIVDNSISKTINLPHNASKDDVATVIIQAWRTGVKGFTVYRDGCRNEQVYSKATTDADTTYTLDAPNVPKMDKCTNGECSV